MSVDKEPLVTAVITTFERIDVLPRALQSVLVQTYLNLEIIVVIDGPDPSTEYWLTNSAPPHLRILALPRNVGISEARNLAARESKGEWIAFLDDDDEWRKDKIELQMRTAHRAGASANFIVSKYLERGEEGTRIRPSRFPLPAEDWSESFYCHAILLLPSAYLIRRSVLVNFPFRSDMRRHGDLDWLLRAHSTNVLKPVWIDDVLMTYHCEAKAARISSRTDWRSRYQWYLDNSTLLTKKAVPYFIGMLCIPEAKQSEKPWHDSWFLLRAAMEHGHVTADSLIYLIGVTVTSRSWRAALRRRWPFLDMITGGLGMKRA